MKQIKFRIWDIGKKVFIPTDVYGIITTDFNAFAIMIQHWEDYREGEFMYESAQIVSQFTGLKDKTGKEIYEGDILKHSPSFGCEWAERYSQVIYQGASFWEQHKHVSFVLDDHDQSIEIIGNIYETPNLL